MQKETRSEMTTIFDRYFLSIAYSVFLALISNFAHSTYCVVTKLFILSEFSSLALNVERARNWMMLLLHCNTK